PFLLLNRRTRAVAFGFVLGFHFLNSRLFEIGMFPWLMIVATTIFFEPDWPRRMWHALRAGRRGVVAAIGLGVLSGFIVGGFLPRSFSIVMAATGAFGVAVLAYHLLPERVRFCELPVHAARTPWRGLRLGRPTAIALIGFAALQVLLPMRHWLIPGNVAWTGEGQRFAWQLLVRQESGTARFRVSGPGSNAVGTLSIDDHLTSFQIAKMIVNPDLLVQFAQYLEAYYRSIGVTDDLEIRVEGEVSLNGRSRQPKIDPDVDLTSIRRPYLPPAPWIVPLRPYED
ncbi:MAG TPA: HTTM domain-containing protein, partial [Actinomycetota bacterium]|nr:HTTM domain-containing protein [Actinomycetota bacterium]